MAEYVPPTLFDFRMRFPGFSGFPDDTVQMVLDEAIALEVQDNWISKDRWHATLYLTAHLLWVQEKGVIDPTANGDGGGTPGGGGSSTVTGGQLKRRTVGDVTVEWSVDSSTTKAAAAGNAIGKGSYVAASYYETPYGRRYLELMRRSFPAVRVV
jgi:Protein of unknown function (DUF4054)